MSRKSADTAKLEALRERLTTQRQEKLRLIDQTNSEIKLIDQMLAELGDVPPKPARVRKAKPSSPGLPGVGA